MVTSSCGIYIFYTSFFLHRGKSMKTKPQKAEGKETEICCCKVIIRQEVV